MRNAVVNKPKNCSFIHKGLLSFILKLYTKYRNNKKDKEWQKIVTKSINSTISRIHQPRDREC